MKFEWDEEKRRRNIHDHKIDFVDVPLMFDGPMLVKIDDRKEYGEDRWVGIGFLGPIIAVVVFVEREDDVIHIISARKAESYERKEFTENI